MIGIGVPMCGMSQSSGGYMEDEQKVKRELYRGHMNNKVDPSCDEMYWRRND